MRRFWTRVLTYDVNHVPDRFPVRTRERLPKPTHNSLLVSIILPFHRGPGVVYVTRTVVRTVTRSLSVGPGRPSDPSLRFGLFIFGMPSYGLGVMV